MQVCTECCSVEQGTKEITENGETFEVCSVCETFDDSMQNYDEDAGHDR